MLPGDPACLCVGPERHVLAAGKAAQKLSNLQVQGRICTQAFVDQRGVQRRAASRFPAGRLGSWLP